MPVAPRTPPECFATLCQWQGEAAEAGGIVGQILASLIGLILRLITNIGQPAATIRATTVPLSAGTAPPGAGRSTTLPSRSARRRRPTPKVAASTSRMQTPRAKPNRAAADLLDWRPRPDPASPIAPHACGPPILRCQSEQGQPATHVHFVTI